MLVPAILYKKEIEHNFLKSLYTNDYFFYMGYPHYYESPAIEVRENVYQYAIVNNGKVIGYFSYKVDPIISCVNHFGFYSFDRGNYVIGRDVFSEMEKLIKRFHRTEWLVIGNNPVKKHYDKFCKKHNGRIIKLCDAVKDPDGNYLDKYVYEIINAEMA